MNKTEEKIIQLGDGVIPPVKVESKKSDLPSPTPLKFSKQDRFDG